MTKTLDEFDLIRDIFLPLQGVAAGNSSLLVGIGDDAAVWKGQGNLAFSIDTLVEGVHFTPDISPADLGYRALAVNLSDLAAMGADPQFYTLAITLPEANSDWLIAFAEGMSLLARQHGVALVGGDTTKGPLTITIQVHGLCPKPVLRSGAGLGDAVYVTGTLGDAAAGLALWLAGRRDNSSSDVTANEAYLIECFHRPVPRVEVGRLLVDYASAMMDVSDGLLADLSHIARASQVAIEIDAQSIPLSQQHLSLFDRSKALKHALAGGDDYELVFTVPVALIEKFDQRIAIIDQHLSVKISKIGVVTGSRKASNALNSQCVSLVNLPENSDSDSFLEVQGYKHF